MEEKEVKLSIQDYKVAVDVFKHFENFEILYRNIEYYYGILQRKLLEHKGEIYKEWEEKMFPIVSLEEYNKRFKITDDKGNIQFVLNRLTLYYWATKNGIESIIALYGSVFLRFLLLDKKKNMEIFINLLNLLNRTNPGQKISFGASTLEYPVISKEVFWTSRWYYIIEPDDIKDKWFRPGVFIVKSPSVWNLKLIKENISGSESTDYKVILWSKFDSIIKNLSKLKFIEYNKAELEFYRPYLALFFYNHYKYLKSKWWLDNKDLFNDEVLLSYNLENFINLFETYFIAYVISENKRNENLRELALFFN